MSSCPGRGQALHSHEAGSPAMNPSATSSTARSSRCSREHQTPIQHAPKRTSISSSLSRPSPAHILPVRCIAIQSAMRAVRTMRTNAISSGTPLVFRPTRSSCPQTTARPALPPPASKHAPSKSDSKNWNSGQRREQVQQPVSGRAPGGGNDVRSWVSVDSR
ncbi:hypothetical protein BD310DRAFT_923632 [Dichomitus squalens]|uniref:Uncharacterized protein n=1 Tax=Dichomitus squalens TaxID=114155 RepID=A0A4Q9PYY1_9APHY|nr:hypothetical protein BD310DRAFT_923632 [Dichomitus squalens]